MHNPKANTARKVLPHLIELDVNNKTTNKVILLSGVVLNDSGVRSFRKLEYHSVAILHE